MKLCFIYWCYWQARARHSTQPLSSSILLNGMFACAQGRLQNKALEILKRVNHSNTQLSRFEEVKLVEYVCRACGGHDPSLLLHVLDEAR